MATPITNADAMAIDLADDPSDLSDCSNTTQNSNPPPYHKHRAVASYTKLRNLEKESHDETQYRIALAEIPLDAKLRIGRIDYVKMKSLHGSRKKTAWCWRKNIGSEIMRTTAGTNTTNGKRVELRNRKYWKCWHCSDIHPSSTSTNVFNKHLLTAHRMSAGGHQLPQSTIQARLNQSTPTPMDSRAYHQGGLTTRVFSDKIFDALIYLLVLCHLAFSIVEHPAFQTFVRACNPIVADLIPTAGNTMRCWILTRFQKRKTQLKEELCKSMSGLIHFSFDLWTSPNYRSLLGIVAHYIDSNGRNRSTLLAIRELRGVHSGENQAEIVMEIIMEYNLEKKIGYFVLDNASNNDTCVDIVLYELTDLKADARRARRLRCLGHVLNLSAKALLYGKDFEAFDTDVNAAKDSSDLNKELNIWRRRGCVGKLHNLVVFIRRTPQRRADFARLASSDHEMKDFNHLELIADNATRWNSLYQMIERALKLRDRIDMYTFANRGSCHGSKQRGVGLTAAKQETLLQNDLLTEDDWLTLNEIMQILKPFYDYTLYSEAKSDTAHRGTLSEYIILLNKLTEIMRRKRDEYKTLAANDGATNEIKFLSASVMNAWLVLDKYFAKLDECGAHFAAVTLQPTMNWKWFEVKWPDHVHPDARKWRGNAKSYLYALWEDYVNLEGDETTSITSARSPYENENDMTAPDPDTTDLDRWIAAGPRALAQGETVLGYWVTQAKFVPNLAQMALDMLCIPAMSAECERVFSSAKLLISDRRNRLKPDIIEACECLRAWLIQDMKDEGTWKGIGWRPRDL
jgi:hAT family C-terminal dimerisation region